MRKFIYITILISTSLLFYQCGWKERDVVKSPYIVDEELAHTPVKDQGNMQACWIYAYLACVETERIEQFGDSMNLSPMWLVRFMLEEQAQERYLSRGNKRISVRGIGPEAELLLQKYGMVPYTHYKLAGDLNSKVVERNLTNQVDVAIRAKKGLKLLSHYIESALPTLPHNLEEGFYLYSMHYTPMQFGKSLLDGVDFEWFTSYTHHPFGEPFDLEVPDNRRHMEIMNVPIDSLYRMTVNALKHHHAVYWEGDMDGVNSSYLRSGASGTSQSSGDKAGTEFREQSSESKSNVNKSNEKNSKTSFLAVQKKRQKAFETFKVTDDHAMEILGLVYDKKGNIYFVCKNSWGKEYGDAGFCYMSRNAFLRNTMIIGLVR